MILNFGLQDMGYTGNNFTWSNNRRGSSYVAARLDRALCNHQWLSLSSDPQLTHLPKISSNHSPLHLSHNQCLSPPNAPIKFEAMWTHRPYFLRLVEDNWNTSIVGHSQYALFQNLKMMKLVLKAWNKCLWWSHAQSAPSRIRSPSCARSPWCWAVRNSSPKSCRSKSFPPQWASNQGNPLA